MTYGIKIEALAPPTRRAIFERLAAGPSSVGALAAMMPVSRPAVSQHLKALKDAGLVSETRDGTARIYRIEPAAVAELRDYFDGFWDIALDGLQALAGRRGRVKEYMKSGVAPVVKTLSLKAPPAKAFAHFTGDIAVWWPLATHSLSQAAAKTVTFEAKKGGRVFETDATGREREWGRVRICDAPHRLVFTWALENPADATEVEVTFEPDGEGGTDFTLVHRGWLETKSGAERRDMYDGGWAPVLSAFVQSGGF